MIETLRYKIGSYILSSRIKKVIRHRTFHNFDSAKTIGILFSAAHQESYTIAKNFMSSLHKQNVDVTGLAYVKTKEALTFFPYHEGISFFALTDTNWYRSPLHPKVLEFINQPIDILIDLASDESLHLKYIVGLSRARFKVGKGNDKQKNLYDFMLDVKPEKSMNYYIDQIKHYLSVMQKG